jgi:aryl-alcohol dehydrogenase-like predicted oxidoreductase
MDYRLLPHTELKVSRLSFGTMTFGSQADEAESTRMVNACLNAGIHFFDTANMYNQGLAETILGKALGPNRKRVILATKVRSKMGEAPDDVGLSRAAMNKAIQASLRRLGTDYVDVYYLHMPDSSVEIEETLEAMDELVRKGLVRYPAISNYAGWQVAEILWISSEKRYRPPHISQPMYNLLARGIEEEYLAFCRRFGVAVITYNPLAGGLLTGKHARDAHTQPGTRFDKNPLYLGRYWHDVYFDAVEELRDIASEAGMTLVELAIRWVLSQEAVDSVILGASRLGQLQENLAAAERGPLDQATLEKCDVVWKKLRGPTPKYNR